jgi:GT2 family glycosyltransferase
MISIVIPAYNQAKLTVDCLNGITRTYGVEHEVILVDDCSKEAMYSLMGRLYPGIKIIRNPNNLGFAKSVNAGIKEATGEYILLLNNDVQIKDPGWLKRLVEGARSRNLDLASAAGGRLDKDYNYVPGEAKTETDSFSYLAGWCLLIKREVFDKIGLIPEAYGRGFWEDVEFCFRAKESGFKLGIVELNGLTHLYHSTFKGEGIDVSALYNQNREIFLKRIKQK